MKLLYFTASYPYGIGERWKKYELEVLKGSFDDILVIPFHYGNNRDFPKEEIAGVRYVKPLFNEVPIASFWNKLFCVLKSPFLVKYLKELRYVGCNRYKLSQWLYSSFTIEKIRKHPKIQKLLFNASEDTVAYFFWGRKPAEIVAVLDNSLVKSIIKLHRYDLYDYCYESNYIPYQSVQVKNANLLLTISNDGRNYLTSKYPKNVKKIKVNRLGAMSEGLSTINEDVFTIASCSRLVPLKRVEMIARSLKDIDVKLNWVHLGDGECMTSIKEIVEELPSNISVEMKGHVDSNEVLIVYIEKGIDLFINVSTSEGVPVSIMEAMSAGIPVLATDVGGTSEIVNTTNGKLLDVNITDRLLAEEIMKFYQLSLSKKQTMRENAYQTYHKKYDAYSNVSELVGLIKELYK